ncbi:MAG: hypothetical protein JTT11_08090 [Candidatus Brockarchaeota archaeon]|nr:hypothetical protein [Candidatus Brockarchaeota archaeon]
MGKAVSTLILASVAVALALALAAYYPSLVNLFTRQEGLRFDHAYATVKDGQAEIVVHFKNVGGGKLTVIGLEVNGIEMVPKGKSPFPIELPSGTNARLGLHASLDTFKHGVTYEIAIITASGGRYVKAVVVP